ncbi:MAG TPA: SpoIIE family protein phosphatase [Phycisphaerae bacterium]|nr:SpoIIE family protein phosphatase [Phycisphaerae bacterium]
MRIRAKLLLLLLGISLAPLLVSSVFQRMSVRRLGSHLAGRTRDSLTVLARRSGELRAEQSAASGRLLASLARDSREVLEAKARRHLQLMVDDYGRMLKLSRKAVETAVELQAREVEFRLAGPPPAAARGTVYFADRFKVGGELPPDANLSETHMRLDPNGRLQPMLISMAHQAYVLPPGVREGDVRGDIARLSTMSQVYQRIHQANPHVVFWQYTALETGVHTGYPGKGGYPQGYDGRQRPWYLLAKRTGKLTWAPPAIDALTLTVLLPIVKPVRRPDGSLAGVTGLDVPLTGVFRELQLPEAWSAGALTMLAAPGPAGGEHEGHLVVLAENVHQRRDQPWRKPAKLRRLECDDPNDLAALAAEARAGRPGVRKMLYRGRACLCAHGAAGPAEPFPIVIVPYELVVAEAVGAEQHVMEQTAEVERRMGRKAAEAERFAADQTAAAEQHVLAKTAEGLRVTGVILLAVVLAAVAVAYFSSRTVTEPVRRLAVAAERLAGGDCDARADIRSRDELGDLGKAFNEMGPKLREHENMRHSLEVAMEVQQSLLPQGPPSVEGFDISGASMYCDETGGDYYDFIDLVELGPGRVGLAVGDVTGHGIGAALLMASARAVLRSRAVGAGQDLEALFAALNSSLVRDTGEDRFMTLFYGVLDGPGRTIRWTSGGHDPPLWLRRATGHIEELPNTGIPLGVLEGVSFPQAGPVSIDTGDVIVIGTDGIWEAENASHEMFGKERLADVMKAFAGRSAADIRAAVVEAVRAFCRDAPQRDDITLVVIKAL